MTQNSLTIVLTERGDYVLFSDLHFHVQMQDSNYINFVVYLVELSWACNFVIWPHDKKNL